MARINGERLIADLRELARIGAFATGVDRTALSPHDIEARRWCAEKLNRAGLAASMDRIGNVLGRFPGADRAILIGSHTDTVPRGGWLDGALGIAYAIEIARSAIEAEEDAAIGIDVINFQDEEGTFLPFLGSRTFFASVDEAEIEAARSAHGAALAAALDPICREPSPHRFEAGRHLCYLEAHIEQGPRLEAAGQRIGVVSGLVGIRRFRIRSHGAANHAGTTPMAMRRDAGLVLIELAAAITAEFRRLADPDAIWNIGNIKFSPGAANVVPGEGEMLVEFRGIDSTGMDRFEERLMALIDAARRGRVGLDVETIARLAPTAMAEPLRVAIAAASAARGAVPAHLASGAGHDAMVAARCVPAAMMFVPSIGGISHDVRENTSDADIVFGCEVLADSVAHLRTQVDLRCRTGDNL